MTHLLFSLLWFGMSFSFSSSFLFKVLDVRFIAIIFRFSRQYIPDPLLIEPSKYIREYLLELTPIGTSIEDVLEVIYKNEEWRIDRINYEQGYIEETRIIGEKSIRVMIGEYKKSFDFYTAVEVSWGFDENSKLIDIYVRKDVDAL